LNITKQKAGLFIDASNFYHSMKEENDTPFDADQYAQLVKELGTFFDLSKIYFYDSIKDISRDPMGYAGQQRFHERLKKAVPKITLRTRPLRYVLSITQEKAKQAAKDVNLPANLNDKLYLFLKKVGVVKLTREKGLDVLLAVDMVQAHKKEGLEVLIILSGDSDFVPAVQLARQEGATVVNLHAFAGSSKELRDTCNEHIKIVVDITGKPTLTRYTP